VGVDEAYSVARFRADASLALAQTRAMGRLPIFVGGTGLYFGVLTDGLADIPAVPAAVRTRVAQRRDALGADAFFDELARRDPVISARLRASDRQRVLRAYEVHEATGRPLSAWQGAEPLPALLAGLRLLRIVIAPERAELHRRIDQRFLAMLDAGGAEEAVRLKGLDPARPAAKILGLRELWAADAGLMTRDAAIAAAQAATRQYAKRQLTWFRHRMEGWIWTENGSHGNFMSDIMSHFS
jgi:tRNA dimethylallyltransferase